MATIASSHANIGAAHKDVRLFTAPQNIVTSFAKRLGRQSNVFLPQASRHAESIHTEQPDDILQTTAGTRDQVSTLKEDAAHSHHVPMVTVIVAVQPTHSAVVRIA